MTETGFTKAQREAIMLRDGGICVICGRQADEVNHRNNRGHGGRLSLNRLDNGCALCRFHNWAIESDPVEAQNARDLGVKLRDGDSYQTPMWSPFYGRWLILYDTHCVITEYADRHVRPDLLLAADESGGVVSP